MQKSERKKSFHHHWQKKQGAGEKTKHTLTTRSILKRNNVHELLLLLHMNKSIVNINVVFMISYRPLWFSISTKATRIYNTYSHTACSQISFYFRLNSRVTFVQLYNA